MRARKAAGESRRSIASISLPSVTLQWMRVRVVWCARRGRLPCRPALPLFLHRLVIGQTERLLPAASVEQDAPRLDVYQPCLLNTISNLIHGLHTLFGQIRNNSILITLSTGNGPHELQSQWERLLGLGRGGRCGRRGRGARSPRCWSPAGPPLSHSPWPRPPTGGRCDQGAEEEEVSARVVLDSDDAVPGDGHAVQPGLPRIGDAARLPVERGVHLVFADGIPGDGGRLDRDRPLVGDAARLGGV